MIENGKKERCLSCGEPVETDEHQNHCPVCYWERRLQRIEFEISQVYLSPEERRKQTEKEQKALKERSLRLEEYRRRFYLQQAWWRRLLGIYSDDDKIKRMTMGLDQRRSLFQSSQRLFEEDPTLFLKNAKKRLTLARSGLQKAQKKQEDRLRRDRLDREARLRFAEQSRDSLALGF
jgi:hypothetical protein